VRFFLVAAEGGDVLSVAKIILPILPGDIFPKKSKFQSSVPGFGFTSKIAVSSGGGLLFPFFYVI
jgi:hypothetical protein